MMSNGPKKTVGVTMPLELYAQLKEQVEKRDRSIPSYIRQVLKRYLWHEAYAPEELTDHRQVK